MQSSGDSRNDDLGEMSWSEYGRQRIDPQLKDIYFIHLSDLLFALTPHLRGTSGLWLDYGSNTSPYADFFKSADLRLADVRDISGVDYVIPDVGPCPASDNTFDGILSTQVLEHAVNPRASLQDCWRMLKPGGRLIATTHGIWEDHGCPYDYRRWTADGLRLELTDAGFDVKMCQKLTTGPRALLQLAMLVDSHAFLYRGRSSFLGLSLHVFGRIVSGHREAVNRYARRFLDENRVSVAKEEKIYIGLLGVAEKPLQPAERRA